MNGLTKRTLQNEQKLKKIKSFQNKKKKKYYPTKAMLLLLQYWRY